MEVAGLTIDRTVVQHPLLGDAQAISKDGRVLTYDGKDYVYLTAGNGSSGFRVFRLVQ